MNATNIPELMRTLGVQARAAAFDMARAPAARKNAALRGLEPARRERFLRDGDRMVTRVLDPAPWPDVEPAALEARRGTLVVLHGLLPHASAPNRSARARHAYALHLIDGRADYPSDNWLQRPGQPLRGFS